MTIPQEYLTEFAKASDGMQFGRIMLEATYHDGKPRFRLEVSKSLMIEKQQSGTTVVAKKSNNT